MTNKGVNLCSIANATSTAVKYDGGRSVLVIDATAFPTTCQLQFQNGISGTWVPVNSTNITANGVYPFDLPTGYYRLYMNGGTPAAVTASIASVAY